MFAAASRLSQRCIVPHMLRQQRLALGCFSTQSSATLIINAVGKDRCGIVSDITGHVISHGGNVGESQAAKLGKHFSLMMLVELPRDRLGDLKDQLENMTDMNAAVFEAQDDGEKKITPQIGYAGYFTLEGADNPGIVHKITTVLAKHRLSVDKMETGHEIAPHGGTELFRMRGVATSPAPLASGFDIQAIKTELRELGDSLNCDVTMEDVQDESASGSFYAG